MSHPPAALRRAFLALSAVLLPSALAVPLANPDSYEVLEDRVLVADAAAGVSANDSAGSTALLVSDVSNGVLDLNPDGSFTYAPAPDFNGGDSFTYLAEESPQTLTFTVDRSRSNVDFSVTISAAGITQSQSDNSSLTGSLELELQPATAPFAGVHVTDVNLVVADDIALNYGVIFLLDVRVTADGGDIELDMTQAGAQTAADVAGAFLQTMNDFELGGDANVNVVTDNLGLGIPNGPQVIDTFLEDIDLDGLLVESGGIITLTLPVAFEGTFDLSGTPAVVEIAGTVVATAPVPVVQQSAPTTVTIDVDPINDAPLASSEGYRTSAGLSLAVPSVAPGPDEVLVAAGSTWRYLDDGSDQGTAWRENAFDHVAWASGAAKLGYGENDEATVISDGGDPDNVHVTSYFRHEFELAQPDGAGALLLRLQRDDGAAVYLNGVEIARDNLADGAGFDDFATAATGGADETAFFEFLVPSSALLAGTNLVAVEIHQAAADSSDVSFDLELLRAPASGVLANDSDIDGDSLTASVVGTPVGGVVALALDGSFTFTPTPGFSGVGSFVYAVGDNAGNSLVELISSGAEWSFLDDGSDQGVAWRAGGFDDTGWARGAAELGYGEGDEITVVGFGGDADNKFPTTYFRHAFSLGDPAAISALSFRLLRDDAAAVYLNGSQVYRDATLPAGAGYLTLATGAVDENAAEVTVSVDPSLLVAGANIVAVEVHQSSASSSDLSFALRAEASTRPNAVALPRGSGWSYLDDGSDLGTAWRGAGFDDSAWASGASPLGYNIGETTTVDFGGDADAKHATTYFRTRFEVVGAAGANAARLKVRRDDGVAVYLNGVEIARDGLAPGAGAADFATATTGDSDVFREFAFDPALLVEGENLLAAEVHQASGTSSDIVFDAELAFSSAQVLRRATIDVVGGTGVIDSDMDGMADSYETANGLVVGIDDSALDLDGDGRSNISEFIAGTNADDPNSFLGFTAIADGGAGQLALTAATVPTKTYQMQSSADGEIWMDEGGAWIATATSQNLMVTMGGPARFWRLRVVFP